MTTKSIPTKTVTNNIDLSITSKKRFTINGDENTVIYLNTSDINVLTRLSEVLPKFDACLKTAGESMEYIAPEDTTEKLTESLQKMTKTLNDVDKELRELVNYIFDYDVCSVASPYSALYDLFEGQYRFEYIISSLMALYEDNLQAEYKKVNARFSEHTSKYTKGKKK